MGRAGRADLFQLAQDYDLWWHQRDSEEHHRQSDPGAVTMIEAGPPHPDPLSANGAREKLAGCPSPRFSGEREGRAQREGEGQEPAGRRDRWISISAKNSGCCRKASIG